MSKNTLRRIQSFDRGVPAAEELAEAIAIAEEATKNLAIAAAGMKQMATAFKAKDAKIAALRAALTDALNGWGAGCLGVGDPARIAKLRKLVKP